MFLEINLLRSYTVDLLLNGITLGQAMYDYNNRMIMLAELSFQFNETLGIVKTA
jgi:hypothetical protein